jgi:hypothetical protein
MTLLAVGAAMLRSRNRALGYFAVVLNCFLLLTGMSASAQPPGQSNAKYEKLFQQTLAQPTNIDVAFRFAEVAAQLGDYEAAIGALERILFYNPNLPRVKFELGVLYYKLGSYAMARTYFESAIQGENAPPEVRNKANSYLAEISQRVSGSIYFSVLAGGGSVRSTIEDGNPNGSGFAGGGSLGFIYYPAVTFPAGYWNNIANWYRPGTAPQLFVGAEATLLGTNISGTDLGVTSRLPWLGFINGQVGLSNITVVPGYPLSLSAVGGFAFGDFQASGFGDTDHQVMTGYDFGVKADLKVSQSFKLGLEVVYFDLGSTNLFNGAVPVSERGTLVLGSATFQFNALNPAPLTSR